MASNKAQLTIANICYANVLHLFASFHNPEFRGPNFTWESFPEMCIGWAYTWLITSYTGKITPEILQLAMGYTWEIATKATKDANLYIAPRTIPEHIQAKIQEDIRQLKENQKATGATPNN